MDFGVLGPITAWHDGRPVSVGSPRQRCVLGVLLVDLGREVTVERLIDSLWGDEAPRTARSIIHVQISHLRRAFPDLIHTTAGGYLADTDPERVDLHRFRRLADQARGARDPGAAVALWEKALACWRGTPLSGTGSDRLWYTVSQPLLEERWTALTAWAEQRSALGHYTEVIHRLTPAVREAPLRERPRYLLIAALYLNGQRTTAMSVFHETREVLAEELGIDPGHELMALYRRMLDDEETPTPASPESTPEAEEPPEIAERNDLPRDLPDFTGRAEEIRRILRIGDAGADTAEVCVIRGPGGAGKTTLAIHAAHRLAERYPDARLFIDLHGHTADNEPVTAFAALGSLLRAVGTPAESLPDSTAERAALWRATLAGKRALIVLDNALSSAHVTPLLPASPGSLVLVTSRNDLSGLGGAQFLALDMLDVDASVRLLAAILGTERTRGEPEAVSEVARLCGGLPLALRIVAARMLSRPRWTFAHIQRRLGQHDGALRELRTENQSVEAIFALSLQSLNDTQREAFLMLGVMVGTSIDVHGAAALLGRNLAQADSMLQDLVSACLLEETSADLYRFHDLIGAYAHSQAMERIPATSRAAGRQRLGEYYLHTATRAAEWLGPRAHDYEVVTDGALRYRLDTTSWDEAITWFDTHKDNLAAVVEYFADQGQGRQTWQLAHALWRFYAVHGQTELWLATHERALAACRADSDETGSAITLVGLGIAHCLSGQFDTALALLTEARDIFTALGDTPGEIRALANVAMVYERMGRFTDALEAFSRVHDYAVGIEDRELEALQLANIAMAHQALGNHTEAIEYCRATLDIHSIRDAEANHAAAWRVLGEAHTRLGEYERAFEYLQRALRLFQGLGDQTGEIYTRNCVGVVLRERGEIAAAIEAHCAALELGRQTSQHSADAEILNELGVTYGRAGRAADARAAHERALQIARERDERYAEARALWELARVPGTERGEAEELLRSAERIFEELGLPEAREVAAELDTVRAGT